MTTQQITDLRKLLAEATPLSGLPSHEALRDAAVSALPALLDAAEREQRLREALRELRQWAGSLQMSVVDTIPASTFAKVNAALAETEPTRGLDSKAKTV